VDDHFVSVEEAMCDPLAAAAANWRALAFLAASLLSGKWPQALRPTASFGASQKPIASRQEQLQTIAEAVDTWCLLLDIGSTTTDLIPLCQDGPATESRTDLQRLTQGELLYLGSRRTPLCALLRSLSVRHTIVHPAAEFFADIYDAFLVLELVAERPDLTFTADGRPATISAARQRLARMLCADATELCDAELQALAETALAEWESRFAHSWQRLVSRLGQAPRAVVLAGEGEWLGRRCLACVSYTGAILSIAEMLGPAISQAACAYAVAWLAAVANRGLGE
jgi:probable H4MPT-linked C1 transfer pathway protein